MTLLADPRPFELPEALEADAPPEADGRARDDVRMLVAERSTGSIVHDHVRSLPAWLTAGDALVLNVSQTVPAALPARDDVGRERVLHLATPVPGTSAWIVEPRRRAGAGTGPEPVEQPATWTLPRGGRVELLARYPDDGAEPRLWVARLELPVPLDDYRERHGEPVRYGYVREPWPLEAYRTAHGVEPGSAEMPSAGRPLTSELLASIVANGVQVVPVVLHCGLSSSPEPLPERFEVAERHARRLNEVRARGGRVIAVGTTVVRALESSVDRDGVLHGRRGTTDLVLSPDDRVTSVDGLVTGWHEPDASHLDLLTAVGGRDLIQASYRAALDHRYRWHEFGDLHLILL